MGVGCCEGFKDDQVKSSMHIAGIRAGADERSQEAMSSQFVTSALDTLTFGLYSMFTGPGDWLEDEETANDSNEPIINVEDDN